MDNNMTKCGGCGKKVSQGETYSIDARILCEDCATKAGLFPLGHTGLRRDRIAENGRRLTAPEQE